MKNATLSDGLIRHLKEITEYLSCEIGDLEGMREMNNEIPANHIGHSVETLDQFLQSLETAPEFGKSELDIAIQEILDYLNFDQSIRWVGRRSLPRNSL